MNILFLHSLQSTPGGLKPTYVKHHGYTVLNSHLPDDDFDAAVAIAQAESGSTPACEDKGFKKEGSHQETQCQ
jgi:hypothetical protein